MENIDTPTYKVAVVKVDTPDYAKRIAEGLPLPCNPYKLSIDKTPIVPVGSVVYYSDGSADQHINPVGQYVESVYPNAYKSALKFYNSVRNERISNSGNGLLAKIQMQSLPLLMMYRERKETNRLLMNFLDKAMYACKNIRHPSKVLRNYGLVSRAHVEVCLGKKLSERAFRRFKRRLALEATSAKDIGNAWLLYRFAWKPLIADISDSLKAAETAEKKSHTFNRTNVAKTDVAKHFNEDLLVITGGVTITITGIVKYAVEYSITDQSLSAASQLMNIPATVWDAVPYSFVIDWIVDISKYLDLYDATMGTTFTSGCLTQFLKYTITSDANKTHYYPNKLAYWMPYLSYRKQVYDNPSASSEMVRLNRTPLSSFPKPKLEFPLKTSLTHGVDILALSLQKLMKKST